MKKLEAFSQGYGAHWGLSDWYERGEAELVAALAAHEPFDTGWYSSKKEIAAARIWSVDGQVICVEASVSDDFDTEGRGEETAEEWSLEGVARAVSRAWEKADADRQDNEAYVGFSLLQDNRWIETYLLPNGRSWDENLQPPGDHYGWWGWQYDEKEEGVGMPDPGIPAEAVPQFEAWAAKWAVGEAKDNSLTIGEWTMKPWRAY